MKPARKRPGRLWLFFFGRRRRGFPGLLVGMLLLALVLGLSFATHAGMAISYLVGIFFVVVIAVLALGSLLLAAIVALRPRGGR